MLIECPTEPEAIIGSLGDLTEFANARLIGGLIVHVETVLSLPVMDVRPGEMLDSLKGICEVVYVTERPRAEVGRRLGSYARMYASELGGLAAAVSRATQFLDAAHGDLAFVGDRASNETVAGNLRMVSGAVGKSLVHAYIPDDTSIFTPRIPEPIRTDFAFAS